MRHEDLRKGMVVITTQGEQYRLAEPFIDSVILAKHIDHRGRVFEQPDTIRIADLASVEVRDEHGNINKTPLFKA